MAVFDPAGRRLADLASPHALAGDGTLELDCSRWPAGVYLVRITYGLEGRGPSVRVVRRLAVVR